jgi:hypothetical protein
MDPKSDCPQSEQSRPAEPPVAPKKRFRIVKLEEKRFRIVQLEERLTPSNGGGSYSYVGGTSHGHGHSNSAIY